MAYPYSLDDSGDIHMRNEVRTVLNLLRLLEVKESPEDTSYLHGNLGPALEHLFPQPEAAEQHEANLSKKISADIPATDWSIVGAKWLIPCDDNGTYHLGQGTFYWLVHHIASTGTMNASGKNLAIAKPYFRICGGRSLRCRKIFIAPPCLGTKCSNMSGTPSK